MSNTGDSVPMAPPKAPSKKKAKFKGLPVVDPKEALRGTGAALKEQEAARKQAESAALGFLARQQAALKRRRADSEAGKQFYVRCRYCTGPAIWLIGKVRGWLTADNWHSSYKALGVLWPSTDIYCQCCLVSGGGKRMVSVDKDARYQNCTPKKRHIFSMPAEEYRELMGADAVEAN